MPLSLPFHRAPPAPRDSSRRAPRGMGPVLRCLAVAGVLAGPAGAGGAQDLSDGGGKLPGEGSIALVGGGLPSVRVELSAVATKPVALGGLEPASLGAMEPIAIADRAPAPLVRLQSSPLLVRPRPGRGDPILTLGPVLETDGVRSSLESGLPVRVRIVTELWRSRTLDALDGRHEWRASLYLDPLSGRYVVETGEGERTEVGSLAQARSFLQARLAPPLAPARSGTFYYLARMEVETLSLSDLDELRRWLRGDLGPAVEGGEEVGSALGRGLRRLLVRALRLPVERYEARSEFFTR